MTDMFFGKDCPPGKVQVEFVGCDPRDRIGDYGWKPTDKAFLEIYVDGQRFRIDVGSLATDCSRRRGLMIYLPDNDVSIERWAGNVVAVCLNPPVVPFAEWASTKDEDMNDFLKEWLYKNRRGPEAYPMEQTVGEWEHSYNHYKDMVEYRKRLDDL